MQSFNQGGGKSGSLDLRHTGSEKVLSPNSNGSMHQPPLGPASTESGKQHYPGSPHGQNSSASHPQLGMQRPKSAVSLDQERFGNLMFHPKFYAAD